MNGGCSFDAARNTTGLLPGYDWAYEYDAMGNRKSVTGAATYDSGNFSLVENFYANGTGNGTTGGNVRNQYGSRDVPRLVEAQGLVEPGNATVTVNGGATERVGDYWWGRADFTGGADPDDPRVVALTVNATGGNATSSSGGDVYLPPNPQALTYDDDGNLLEDGRWTRTYDAENRLRSVETSATAVAAGVPKRKIVYTYDDLGRRILRETFLWSGSAWVADAARAALYDR